MEIKMNDALIQALQITALGMGLVFGAIIVLWLMMVLLTSLAREKEPVSRFAQAVSLTPGSSPFGSPTEVLREGEELAQAAAIAVAMALAEQELSAARALPTPPTAIVSAWQLGMRTRLLAQKGNARRR